ncbi:hypothetical protein BUALT_Bualt04G0152000 [Buddleja alternifolia]|uniref:CLAVATA3/ESR (CLE)-related protein 25 n=1 Tax=Buddleja alternifolia TaxID=168488 RepID=A0AAV6XQF0_9LAMI|nr:hypothetical protein BUALT_Bualt04G0152000 [Buddleja alternifolia]
MRMGGSRKAMIRAALSVSFFCFLLLVSLANRSNRRDHTIHTIPSTRRSVDSFKPIQTEKEGFHRNFKINCVSKRRVPNGPDPIHNRRVGNSKLPPT